MNVFKPLVLATFLIGATFQAAPVRGAAGPAQAATVCGGCHGVDGISVDPEIPNLAGQGPVYMERQLEEFRHKPSRELDRYQLHIRDSHIMDSQSKRFDAGQLAAMSRYFSGLRCAVENRPVVATQSLRCGECHGNDGISRKPDIPNLAGQKEGYLLAQLKVFKATMLERSKVVPDPSAAAEAGPARRFHQTMGQWAARLSEPEMILAAKYYSGLPGVWVCK